jgi:predicted metal-binding protein
MTHHKIGIIICDRYHRCGGGKCFKSLREREGAFNIYKNDEVEVVGYTTCGGCPGGNIEYVPEEMVKNGADTIHLATGMVVGYPPCPRVHYFKKYIEERFNVKVVAGTHPIPEKYYSMHQKLKTWDNDLWKELIKPALADEKTRRAYN